MCSVQMTGWDIALIVFLLEVSCACGRVDLCKGNRLACSAKPGKKLSLLVLGICQIISLMSLRSVVARRGKIYLRWLCKQYPAEISLLEEYQKADARRACINRRMGPVS